MFYFIFQALIVPQIAIYLIYKKSHYIENYNATCIIVTTILEIGKIETTLILSAIAV